jgi:hypothetical protein
MTDIDESLTDAREILISIYKQPGINKLALGKAIQCIDDVRADSNLPQLSRPSDPWTTSTTTQPLNSQDSSTPTINDQIKELRDELDNKLRSNLNAVIKAIKDPLLASEHAPRHVPNSYASAVSSRARTTPQTSTTASRNAKTNEGKRTTFRERRLVLQPNGVGGGRSAWNTQQN